MMRSAASPRSLLAWLAVVASALGWSSSTPAASAPKEQIDIRVDGVPDDMAANVRSYLTLTRYTTREDLTDTQVRRLADRAVDEAADALRPYGYYAPTIRSRTSRDDPKWIVRLKIAPGEPVVMQTVDVQIVGAGTTDKTLRKIVAESTLKPGTRLDHTSYEALKSALLRTSRDRGYLDAVLTRRELIVNPQALTADARLTIDTGGRYEFGALELDQDVIDDDLLRAYVRFSPGQPYSPEKLNGTQYALEDSNYFSTVAVTPGDRDKTSLTVPVRVHVEPIQRNRYAVNAGYGTDTGIRGQFAWDNRLINTRGHRSRVELTASEIRYEALARYAIPVGDPSLEKLEFTLGYVNEDIGDLESERTELVGGLTQVFGRWQQVMFLKLNDERTIYPDGSSDEALLLIPGISYASLPPNFLTGWVRDAAYYVELSGSPATLGSDASYLRFYGHAERVWPIHGPWYVRGRGEFGTSWIDDFSELPASQRFFAGGDRSVRGFALNELSPPLDPSQTRSGSSTGKGGGGEHKLVGSIEFERDFPKNFRGAVFFDIGNAFNDWSTPLEYSVGIGVRWKLPMLMIGVDVAQALSEPDRSPRLHLNMTQVL